MPLPFYNTYQVMLTEEIPFKKIHRLVDTFEEFTKFLTSISILDFVANRFVHENISKRIVTSLLNKLYTPSLGTWHEFLYQTAEYLANCDDPFSEDICALLGYKNDIKFKYRVDYKGEIRKINNVKDAFSLFTNLRNEYSHGATPSDEISARDCNAFIPLMDSLLAKAGFLEHYRLRVIESNGTYHPIISKNEGRSLALYPFVLYSGGKYYFFNDAKLKHKEKLTFLNYSTSDKIVDQNSYRALKQLFPEFNVYDDTAALRKQKLLETIIGREEDARSIEEIVLKTSQSRVLYIFGDPGIGKSAMAVYLYEYFFTDCIKLLHMFFQKDGDTLQPDSVFRSITRPLVEQGLLPPVELGTTTITEIKKNIDMMLQKASEAAKLKGKRIIIIIDGLDEAYNSSEQLYSILPLPPPPNVSIIYFSRRKEEIYSRLFTTFHTWIATDELKPLSREAVYSILRQGVSKYALNQKVVDKVYKMSQGNPLYLTYLINCLLEGTLSIFSDIPLPRDMAEFYQNILRQIISKNPNFPIIKIALVFCVSSEALNEEQIKKILRETRIEQISLTVNSLSEIIRPITLKSGEKKYQVFHQSFADFMCQRYPEIAKEIEKEVIFSVLPQPNTNIEGLFTSLLEENLRHEIAVNEVIMPLAKNTRKFLSAYKLLSKTIATHPDASELLIKCYDTALSQKDTGAFQFINDCLFKVHEISPSGYAVLLMRLKKRFPKDENLRRHLVEALILLKFADKEYHQIIDLVISYLTDWRLTLFRKNRIRSNHFLNTLCGFARFSETFQHLVNILLVIANMNRTGLISQAESQRIEGLLSSLLKLIFYSPLTNIISALREKDNAQFITKGNESYLLLTVKVGFTVLKLYSRWLDLFRTLIVISSLFVRYGFKATIGLLFKFVLFIRVIQRSFPLIFASAENPVSNPSGIEMIMQLEDILKRRMKMVKHDDTNLYDIIKAETRKAGSEIINNLAYMLSVSMIPVFRTLWNYSGVGLDIVPGYNEQEREDVKRIVHLLNPRQGFKHDDIDILHKFLCVDDAWKNYFAMVSIIIHGNTAYDKCREILLRMLDINRVEDMQDKEATIVQRLRIYRQFFSIYSYLIRRSEDGRLIEEMGNDLYYCLTKLFEDAARNRRMLQHISKPTLFKQKDPFSPILPVGIYQANRTSVMSNDQNKLKAVIDKLLFIADSCPKSLKLKLWNKVFNELISLSLFYPAFAIRYTLSLYRYLLHTDNELANVALDKIGLIDSMMPGYLQHATDYVGFDFRSLRRDSIRHKGRDRREMEVLTALPSEITVFAWHECGTTILVSYERIRNHVMNELAFSFRDKISIQLLAQRGIIRMLKEYFTEEIDEKVKNFF